VKGLAWYSRIVFSLFILGCLYFIVMALMQFSAQSMLKIIAPIVYIVLTALCFGATGRAIKVIYDKKCWAIFGLVWAILMVLFPVILAVSATSALFPILSAGQEWAFISFALIMAILFIPVIVFFAKYLSRVKKQQSSSGLQPG
jgi:hypothetical protein